MGCAEHFEGTDEGTFTTTGSNKPHLDARTYFAQYFLGRLILPGTFMMGAYFPSFLLGLGDNGIVGDQFSPAAVVFLFLNILPQLPFPSFPSPDLTKGREYERVIHRCRAHMLPSPLALCNIGPISATGNNWSA